MADKADDIRHKINRGRQEIEHSRSAITEKLAILETRVQKTVDGVKHTFDLHYQVKQRPWLIFGGSVLVGYMLGPRRGNSARKSGRGQHQLGKVADVRNHFKGEIATIKEAARGVVLSTLWAMAKQALLPTAQNIKGVTPRSTAQPINLPQQNTFDPTA